MKINIEFETTTSAFDKPEEEIQKLMKRIENTIITGTKNTYYLHDSNGYYIGKVEIN